MSLKGFWLKWTITHDPPAPQTSGERKCGKWVNGWRDRTGGYRSRSAVLSCYTKKLTDVGRPVIDTGPGRLVNRLQAWPHRRRVKTVACTHRRTRSCAWPPYPHRHSSTCRPTVASPGVPRHRLSARAGPSSRSCRRSTGCRRRSGRRARVPGRLMRWTGHVQWTLLRRERKTPSIQWNWCHGQIKTLSGWSDSICKASDLSMSHCRNTPEISFSSCGRFSFQVSPNLLTPNKPENIVHSQMTRNLFSDIPQLPDFRKLFLT